ncbi:MAG: hypothetical protein CBD88_07900 [Flavobacteriales bacterium TMED228]|nr:MAG: hypothetical protein CBD88_07900 [Flavobacteriales bacterium TMED228]|tara:strand:- start:1802 stop:3085 length:1284 start_codon:yes stop_codon:yes gene_type:complete
MKQLSSLLGLDPNDLVDNRLTEFLDPEIARANNQVRTFSNMVAGIDPDSYGAETGNFAAGATARGIESLRRGLSAQNDRYATPAELFQQRTQGLDTTQAADRIKALQAARQIDRSQAKNLADAFIEQDIDRATANLANAPRTAVTFEEFDSGAMFTQDDQGNMVFYTPPTVDEKGNVLKAAEKITDPLAIAHMRGVHGAIDANTESTRRLKEAQRERAAAAMQVRLTDTIDATNGVQDRIGIYDQMLSLIDEKGAEPGFFDSILPNVFRSAPSKEFETLGRQLGLNLISMSSFGQLNESELKLALETEMPRFNNKEEYKEFITRKKAVNEKMLRELLAYSNYLKFQGEDVAKAALSGLTEGEAFTAMRQEQNVSNNAYTPTVTSEQRYTANTLEELEAFNNDSTIPDGTLISVSIDGSEPHFEKKGD